MQERFSSTPIVPQQQQQQAELERLEQALTKATREQQSSSSNPEDTLPALRQAYEDLAYWEQALAVEQEYYDQCCQNHPAQQASSWYRQGKLRMRLEQPHLAESLYEQAMALSENPVEQGNILISKAGVYFHRGDYETALQYLGQAESYFLHSNDDDDEPHVDLVKCLEHSGLVARTMEDYAAALQYYKRALQVWEHLNFMESLWHGAPLEDMEERRNGLLMDTADMHAALDEYDAALRLYQEIQKGNKRWRQQQAQGDEEETALDAILWHNIGKLHAKKGRLQTALRELRTAARMKERIFGDSHPETGKTLSALGAVAAKTDHPREALEAFQQALLIARMHAESDDDMEVMMALRNIAVLKGEKVPKWGDEESS